MINVCMVLGLVSLRFVVFSLSVCKCRIFMSFIDGINVNLTFSDLVSWESEDLGLKVCKPIVSWFLLKFFWFWDSRFVDSEPLTNFLYW